MDKALLVAITAGMGGMVGWGLSDFFAKKTIDRIGDLRTLFWAQLIGVLPLAIAFALHPQIPVINQYDPLFLLGFGIFSALSYLPLYNGFGKGQISILSPIFASYAVLVVILSVLFLGESIPALRFGAILAVLIGILLISTDPRDLSRSLHLKRKRAQGVPQVLSAMVIYSVWLILLDKFLNGKSWLFYLLVIRFVAALTLITYAWVTMQRLWVADRRLWKYLVLIGCFDVGAFSAVSYGFSATPYTSVVAVLSAAFSLPTIALAYLFLKERLTRYQLLSALIIVAGVAFLSLAN